MHGVADLDMPRRVVYGRNAGDVLAAELTARNIRRAVIVTPPSLEAHPYVATIRRGLGDRVAAVCAQLAAHTPDTEVIACAELVRRSRAEGVIAIGGGSVIDGAKLVRLSVDEALSDRAALAAWRQHPTTTPAGRRTCVLAVPTTLSAAEFSGIAGLSDTTLGVKNAFHHASLIPEVVILDPDALTTAPEWLVFSTGIRAVDHCIETLLSASPNPYADAAALHGLRLLVEGLPRLRQVPDDRDNRLNLQFAMWLSMTGPCVGVPLGASHAIGRALGGVLGVPHGRTSCALLAPVLAWNAAVDAERQGRLSALFPGAASSLSEQVQNLVRGLGEPHRLRDLGIEPDDLERVVTPAVDMLKVRSVSGNIRPISQADEVRSLLRAAW